MKIRPSKEWLDRFLGGALASEGDLKTLVKECPKEDQHLDYKAGKLLSDARKDAADTVREYVAAFANSDGGTLLLGYDQSTGFDGVPAGLSATIEEWATRCIYELAPFLSPPPRIFSAKVEGATLLLIATARAPRLVPVVLKGELTYFLRIGESNFAAPPFLLSDLVLGRRNQPLLRVRLSSASGTGGMDIGCPNVDGFRTDLTLVIENSSIAFAEDVRCGLVIWSAPKERPSVRDGMVVPESLKATLDVVTPPVYESQSFQPRWLLTDVRLARHSAPGVSAATMDPPLDLGPLDQTPPQPLRSFTLPVFMNLLHQVIPAEDPSSLTYERTHRVRVQARGAVEVKAALYVLSRDAEPWWTQLTMRYDKQLLQTKRGDISSLVEVGPVLTPRPIVSLGFYTPSGETI